MEAHLGEPLSEDFEGHGLQFNSSNVEDYRLCTGDFTNQLRQLHCC